MHSEMPFGGTRRGAFVAPAAFTAGEVTITVYQDNAASSQAELTAAATADVRPDAVDGRVGYYNYSPGSLPAGTVLREVIRENTGAWVLVNTVLVKAESPLVVVGSSASTSGCSCGGTSATVIKT